MKKLFMLAVITAMMSSCGGTVENETVNDSIVDSCVVDSVITDSVVLDTIN